MDYTKLLQAKFNLANPRIVYQSYFTITYTDDTMTTLTGIELINYLTINSKLGITTPKLNLSIDSKYAEHIQDVMQLEAMLRN